MNTKNLFPLSLLLGLSLLISSCVVPDDDGIGRIRSQRDVDAYNATVSSPGQKLVCSREKVLGTNFREFVCITVAYRDSMSRQARNDLENL
ncbi:MAG: hypothetical protein COC19_04695 [SAR86 cluster bacterium]|uniref:Uncharacterized protein n=1 Tax=SAR86 cluster bacterium TaxID=2030880 RepID=A0A2A4MMI0_9GAMM|nr:MAG: hypothetical protein COC19_04695 [SAR86 cluster bacterium]